MTQLPPSLLGNPVLQESADNVPNVVKEAEYRRRNASPETNRKEWDALVEKMQDKLKKDEKPKTQETYRPTPSDEMPDDTAGNTDKLPVVIQTIRFENADQVIPLNWKLSKRQKLWYLLAWERFLMKGQCSGQFSPRAALLGGWDADSIGNPQESTSGLRKTDSFA